MDLIIESIFFVFGLVLGSFLNVCIYRLPRGLSVVTPGSGCPHCGNHIRPYDNIPVLSWIMLGGKCRKCKSRITGRYALVELITASMFVACYAHFGITLATLKCAAFGFLLIGLIFTDAETHLLPDKMTLTGLVLGLVFSLFVPVNDLASMILPGVFQFPVSSDVSWRLFSFADSLLGAAIGASFLYGAGAIYLRWRGVEGMGFGDVKLMAMIGSFLGLRLTILTILASSLAGSFFGLWTVFVVWIKRTQRRKQVLWVGWATATILGLAIMAGSVARYYWSKV